MKKKMIGIFICMLMIANVSAVLGISKDKVNTIEKTKSFVFLEQSNQGEINYVILDNVESEIPHVDVAGMEPNLAPNPSFEEGDKMPTGWTYDPDTNGTFNWDSDYAHSGEKSVGVLNLTKANNLNTGWTTTDFIPVHLAENEYIFSGWIKYNIVPSNPDQTAILFIWEYDENYTLRAGEGTGWYFTPEWCFVWAHASINYSEIKYVKLALGQYYDHPHGNPDPLVEVRFDDVYFGLWNNSAPDKPTITGETRGKNGTLYNYTITTIDDNQDEVFYEIDWDDNTTTTTDLYESGEEIVISHIWDLEGTYIVKVKATDKYYWSSGWATLTVTMPRSYNIPLMQYWTKLLERFPNAFPILRHLLGS